MKKPNDAYGLDDDSEAGTLTPVAKQLCIQYAVEELGWDPAGDATEQPYPRWLGDERV